MQFRWIIFAITALSWAYVIPEPQLIAADPTVYLRTTETPQAVGLEIALRRFDPEKGDGPQVWLSAVAHLGSAAYYAALQEHLDAQDHVLYEGVGGPGFLNQTDNPNTRRARTASAIRFAASMVEYHRSLHQALPETLEVARLDLHQRHRLLAGWLRRAQADAWGHPLIYQVKDESFTLTSLGADGQPGGEGENADLALADQPPLSAREKTPRHGLQSEMARALNLVFQLEAIDYDRPHFHNSDLGAAGIAERAQVGADRPARDGDLDQLMALMDGSSAMGVIAKFGVRMIGAIPYLRHMTRLMLIESLGNLNGDLSKMKGMPPAMKNLMRTIIDDRNAIVMADLQRLIDSDHPPKTISIFYGAGHMADLERRLRAMGYRPAQEQWLTAIDLNYAESGLHAEDVKLMRALARQQMRQLEGGN